MWRLISAATAGGVFGAGLLISGMVDSQKVQAWLDVFGAWDPTLAFVLGGAVLPMIPVWRIAARHKTALLGDSIPAPKAPRFERSFILGSILFGMGWALVGLCPGPALAVLSFGGTEALVFLFAMLAAMIAAPAITRQIERTTR